MIFRALLGVPLVALCLASAGRTPPYMQGRRCRRRLSLGGFVLCNGQDDRKNGEGGGDEEAPAAPSAQEVTAAVEKLKAEGVVLEQGKIEGENMSAEDAFRKLQERAEEVRRRETEAADQKIAEVNATLSNVTKGSIEEAELLLKRADYLAMTWRPTEALTSYTSALEGFTKNDNAEGMKRSRKHMGLALVDADEVEKAASVFPEFFDSLSDEEPLDVAHQKAGIALHFFQTERETEYAAGLLEEALDTFRDYGAMAKNQLAFLCLFHLARFKDKKRNDALGALENWSELCRHMVTPREHAVASSTPSKGIFSFLNSKKGGGEGTDGAGKPSSSQSLAKTHSDAELLLLKAQLQVRVSKFREAVDTLDEVLERLEAESRKVENASQMLESQVLQARFFKSQAFVGLQEFKVAEKEMLSLLSKFQDKLEALGREGFLKVYFLQEALGKIQLQMGKCADAEKTLVEALGKLKSAGANPELAAPFMEKIEQKIEECRVKIIERGKKGIRGMVQQLMPGKKR
uniref:MalT-like TPR region domain-containing protein n=1 Tax=Chromera velia CCMP2878 TaxID=1169474 RepID=A0A0G4F7N6_9ALVE|eukprot:Cvel_15639.t1-p1 / transcript=Cvel_15639.t1 / gene=Cvel_15639 / organism=Chromera_velia_CCMP2878 / gene_product=hypothetical protein / transcript_product=hypothetical protein / location=Cvel_scaffold1165:49686-53283(+) / protein_length=517 / sequence_SO=supercontig / SO=protein_coding / is_pseudo=false